MLGRVWRGGIWRFCEGGSGCDWMVCGSRDEKKEGMAMSRIGVDCTGKGSRGMAWRCSKKLVHLFLSCLFQGPPTGKR